MESLSSGGSEHTEQSRTLNQMKFKFLRLNAAEVDRFQLSIRTGSSKDLLVWMLLLNTGRVLGETTFKFSPRWRSGILIDSKKLRRSLCRLDAAGLIQVELRKGKSPVVTLIT